MTFKCLTTRGFAGLALGLAMATASHAQPADWQVLPSAGQELTAHLNDRLDIHFGVPDSGPSSIDSTPARLSPVGDEFAFSALVDWSFSDDGLRMRGGARYDDRDSATSPWQFSSVERENIQTYFGVGWDGDFSTDDRLGLSLDMGLAFESVRDTDGSGGDGLRSVPGQSELGSMFESLRYSPSVSAGLEYRF